jgi:hypothetical protein
MSTWVALSEIVRNVALTFAAIVGAILAWRQLSPAALKQGPQVRRPNCLDVRT